MSVKLLKFDDASADIAPVTASDTVEAGQIMLDGVGGIALNAGACLLSNLADPMAPYDAATKGYVDSLVQAYGQSGYPSDGTTTSTTPGKDGKSILAGNSSPGNAIGNVGDLYVQLDNGPYLWGPKAANGWPTQTVLLRGSQGDRGAAGVPGYSIRPSPQEPPSNTLGNNGDYALVPSGKLYGPKAAGAYPTPPLNLVGPKGDSVKGDSGQSVVGPQGASVLYSANTPPDYALGKLGDLALTASGQLYGPKNESSWGDAVFNLSGPKGDVGAASTIPGPSGNGVRTAQSDPPSNALGIDGDYALSAATSSLYGPKNNGVWPSPPLSLRGMQGVQGASVKGDSGSRGASVLYSANNPPASSLGLDGDLSITFDGQLYGPKSSGAWGSFVLSLVGPSGKDGVGQVGQRGASVLQTQSDPPDNGLGLAGDFAISTASSVLYGPKPSSGMWQSGGVSLVGPRGAASTTPGPSGLSVVSGNGAPTTQGNVGDIYVDVQNGNLYAAKSSSGWASSFTSLLGPRGSVGQTGSRGPGVYKTTIYSSQDNLPSSGYDSGSFLITTDLFLFGPFSTSNGFPAVGFSLVGPRGASGQAGATIRSTASTPDASLGNIGDYVFQQDTTSLLGPKTSSGYPSPGTSLRGASGQSITGPRGASILQADANPPSSGLGNVGDYSLTTDGYLYGPKQANGWPQASLYLKGATGAASTVPGARGASVDSGSGPPSAQVGQDGDPAYIDILNGNLYGARTSGAWPTTFTSLIGPQGKTVRGSQIYNGSGPPSSDLTTYSPNGPAQPNDLYLDVAAQKLYVLGS